MLPNNKKGQARWLLVLVIIMAVGMLSACGKKDGAGASASPGVSAAPGATPAHKDSEVAATYKGGEVTYGELNKFINIAVLSDPQVAQYKDIPAFQEDTLKRIVTYKIIGSKVSGKAKTDADAVVKQQMDGIHAYTGEQKTQFEASLKQAGLKIADIQWFIDLSARAQLDLVSKVTDQQVKAFYDKILKESPSSLVGTATLNHILIATKDPADQTGAKQLRTQDEALTIAKDVQGQLKKGSDFVALAKKYSDDPGSKDKGGRYDNADISQFVAEFKKAAAELPLNTISEPILTQYGYHVMKVESRTTKTLAEVTQPIKQNLAAKEMQTFMTNELPKNEYKSNLPKPTPAPSATPAPSTEASPTATPVE